MSRNEYFYIFEAIIYSIALSEILIGVNRMVSHRREIKFYWAHSAAVILYIFILITHYTWSFYRTAFELVDNAAEFILL